MPSLVAKKTRSRYQAPGKKARREKLESQVTSRPSRLKLGVEPLEFDGGVGGCELPIGFGVMLVSIGLPGCDLAFED